MKEAMRHGAVAFLTALGLTLALLGCMDMLAHGWMAAAVIAALILVLTVASVKKLTRFIALAAVAAGGAIWLLAGGMEQIAEILRAVTLHFTGLNGVLPMVAQPTAMILSVVLGAAAFVLTGPGMGVYPALAVTLLTTVLLWLGDCPGALPWLAPAVAGVMVQAACSNHEGLNLRRILPLMAVISALTFLCTPSGGVTIQPLKDAADKLRDQIYARFMFTQPRNVFTLASEGYYPQGQHQLGGAAEPNEHPVLLAKTPRKTYLRGSVKNEYTGRVWLDTMAGRRYLWSSFRWQDIRTDTFDMALPQGALGEDSGLTAYQTVSVKMLDGSASSLFVPQRIRSLNPGGELVPYFNSGSEVFVTRDLQAEDTYTVTAPLMLAGDPGLGTLIQACESTEDPRYPEILHEYTALPEHLQDQVFQLAHAACEGAATPYEKAIAIQNFLSRTYRYTLEVAPQPEDIDFVSNFLLNTKEGYCTYFASAMTVLCRMVGLPARYVEGYLAEPDDEGHAYVTGLQGHAWTEVYFDGFGWLTFDATPSQNNAQQAPEEILPPETQEEQPEDAPEPENDPPPVEEPTPSPEPDELPPEEESTPQPSAEPDADDAEKEPPSLWWLWWLVLLAAAAAVALRIVLTQPEQCANRAKDEMGRWSAWNQAVSDQLRVLHLSRQPSESPIAHMRRIDGLRRFPVEMTPLGECMALVFYGRLSPEPEETAMAAQAYRKIDARMTWWQKLQLMLLRAFTPEKKRLFSR